MNPSIVLAVLGGWFLLSVPVALVIGRFLSVNRHPYGQAAEDAEQVLFLAKWHRERECRHEAKG